MPHQVTPTNPPAEPQTFVRGTTVEWTRGFADFLPEDGWILTYHFVAPDQKKTVLATDNLDSTFAVVITAADSDGYAAGDWSWQAVVVKAAETFVADRGTLVIEEGFAAITEGHDVRSFAVRMLELVEAAIESDANSSELSVSVDGYTATFEAKSDLLAYRAKLRSEVAQEKDVENRRRGEPTNNRIAVRF